MTKIKDKFKKSLIKKKGTGLPLALTAFVFAVLLVFSQLFYVSFSIKPRLVLVNSESGIKLVQNPELLEIKAKAIEANLDGLVLPAQGASIPVRWGDMGKRLVEEGVIDKEKFYSLYEQRGGLSEYEKELLENGGNGEILVNSENSNTILNLLWAFGLANKNIILEEGPMVDKKYGGDAGKYASTGGWSLANGSVMDHYSAHELAILTEAQQELVERVTKGIYRPCCGNSTHFPDCNHGMAMLGLMELMASQGATEQEMYDAALAINSFWFPETYLTIGKYFARRGVSWEDIEAKEVLGSAYSSAQGYAQIAKEVEPVQGGGGGSCGV